MNSPSKELLPKPPIVRPAERSIWAAPVYAPPPWPQVRPGAEAALPSRGVPC